MAELVEVAKRQFSSTLLVEDHIGDSLDFAMTGNHDHRQAEALLENGVDDDKTFDRSLHQQARVFLDEIGLAAMAGGQIEVALLDEELLDPCQNLGGIAVAELGNQNADGKGLPLAQGARIEAGTVIEFRSRLGHAVASLLGNGADAGRIIQDKRDGGRRKIE